MQTMPMNQFDKGLRQEAELFNLRFDYNIPVGNGRKARGYRGVTAAPRV